MQVSSLSHDRYGPEILSKEMFLMLVRASDQCNRCYEWFDVIFHRFLKKMLEFQVDTTSIKWLLVVTTVTVQSYARKKFPYC